MCMRFITACLLLFAGCWAAHTPASEVSSENGVKYADKEFLLKQKFFLDILRNIYQPLGLEEYLPYSSGWISDESKYNDFKVVYKFFDLFKRGFLPKGEIFTILNHWHLTQTRSLFYFLYNSKDWDTYHKNVVWARENVNEGMFIYAVQLSVIHRKDLHGIVLPVIYELNPYLFFTGDIIHDAMVNKLFDAEFGFFSDKKRNSIFGNYTSKFCDKCEEGRISYYTEDVGMNAYYYYYMLEYSSFLGGDEFGLYEDRRGELFFYMHQQLLARYSLERKGNFLNPVGELFWECPQLAEYHPMLRYWNGISVRSRETGSCMRWYNPSDRQNIRDYEMRIKEAIDRGYHVLSNGTKIDLRTSASVDSVGNIVQGNADSIDFEFFKSYGLLTRMAMSQTDYYKLTEGLWPGALMHYETSMRDPAYYQWIGKNLEFYWRYKSYLPPYTFDELNFNGVKIKSLVLDKLITYFDYFDADISNGFPFNTKQSPGKSVWDFSIYARQKRLNHKPFSYTMTVTSEFEGKGVVRMYLGPQFKRIEELQVLKKHYLELDQYFVDLVVGENVIKRNTKEFYYDVRDRTTYTELYKRVIRAIKGDEQFVLDLSEAHCGWPDRLLLPRGLPSGYNLTVFFIISPHNAPKVQQYSTYDSATSCGAGSGSKYGDSLPFGYPLDREIGVNSFITKNMFFKDVSIYHFVDDEMN
ncbi:hexamerin-1.1-like [Toxorhynchites rutilus septentrionalis]|uniref:hexamerin-1.1-like n=1 Tax=Toxorhynchites rutilus septentrionalis TaxID=329112 RepID=UPI0024799519|nr:hexamerin-1.1-like [Toxorhynchites rutilus septentrionalis]